MTNNGGLDSGVDTAGMAAGDSAAGAEMLFDASSGIAEDEQREILARINSIAEKNRRSLSAVAAVGGKSKRRFKAKKSGGVFPVLVNVIALAFLAGGFCLLSFFQARTDTQVREGAKVYTSDERALIEEIRRETSSSIEEKENEIVLISSKLDEVDTALKELHSNNQELLAEQIAKEQQLQSLQDEYRATLAALQDDRSRILEEARQREANLQAQLEARARELAAAADQSASDAARARSEIEQRDATIGAARAELDRLSREQTSAAAVEAQLSGLFANLNDQIRGSRLDDAAGTLQSMRAFVSTPAFQNLRSIQARRELYIQSINSLDAMVAETIKVQAALASSGKLPDEEAAKALAELQERYSQQEKAIEELKQSLSAGSDLGRQLADSRSMNLALNATIGQHEREIASLKTVVTEKDNDLAALSAENANLTQTAATLRSQNSQTQGELSTARSEAATARSELTAANQQLAEQRTRVQTLTTLNATLTSTINELTAQLNNSPRQQPQE